MANLVRGTFLRIADVRSQPANISVAASRSTPSRRVVPSRKLPDRRHHSTPTATQHRSRAPTRAVHCPKPCHPPGKTVALTSRSISGLCHVGAGGRPLRGSHRGAGRLHSGQAPAQPASRTCSSPSSCHKLRPTPPDLGGGAVPG